MVRGPRTAMKSGPRSPQLEKALAQKRRPNTAINKLKKKKKKKGTLVQCWWECKLVQPLWKTVWTFLKNLKIELLYDLAISLLNIYLKKTKTLI